MDRTIEDAAKDVVDVLYSDSHVELDIKQVLSALRKDLIVSQSLSGLVIPTREEIELLIMGNEDGEIPEVLQERYPLLNALIEINF